MAPQSALSVQVRIQRIITEYAYVSVPVEDAVLNPPDEHGNRRLDAEKVFAVAVALGAAPETNWMLEHAPQITIHPIQGPPPNED